MIDNWFEEYEPKTSARMDALSEYDRLSTVVGRQAQNLYDNFFRPASRD